MAKNSFIIYHDYYEALADLTDEQVGKLFRAIFEYEMEKKEPNFSGELKVAFKFIKKDLDINLDKYESICERNKINGQKGGRPKNPNNPKNPDGFSVKTQKPKKADNDNDNDNDYIVSKKVSNQEKEESDVRGFDRPSYDDIFNDFGVDPRLKAVLVEFIRHCLMNGVQTTNDKLQTIIVNLDMAYNDDTEQKIKSVRNAIAGGYFDIKER